MRVTCFSRLISFSNHPVVLAAQFFPLINTNKLILTFSEHAKFTSEWKLNQAFLQIKANARNIFEQRWNQLFNKLVFFVPRAGDDSVQKENAGRRPGGGQRAGKHCKKRQRRGMEGRRRIADARRNFIYHPVSFILKAYLTYCTYH